MARMRFVLFVILFSAIVVFATGVTPAHAINCGDVLGPGGSFQLQQDLVCLGSGPHLTVTDGAILDLNGHFVTCNGFSSCIMLSGAGVQLFDGVVRGAVHENLRIEGNGHTVKNITSGPADVDVVLIGDNNRLINVISRSGFNPALFILGNNNQISDSIAQCSGLIFSTDGCIRVSGDTNRLSNNFVTLRAEGNALVINGNNNQLSDSIARCEQMLSERCVTVSGDENRVTDNFVQTISVGQLPGGADKVNLLINGNHNVVRRNRIIGITGQPQFGGVNGIVVTGTKNDIRHNTALDNDPFDLRDTSGDCAQNTWKFNTFVTADPACIQ